MQQTARIDEDKRMRGGMHPTLTGKYLSGSLLCVAVLLLIVMAISGCGNKAPVPAPSAGTDTPERIISTAPSITETVFALGAGDRLAGVSKYCKYPPEAASIPSVGGLLDPSREAILRLDPDLVIGLEENAAFRYELSGEGYRVLAVDHKCITGIIDSIETIGRACGREKEGILLAADLRSRIDAWEDRVEPGQIRPRVLISVGRNAGNGGLGSVTIAGQDGFYDEMIRLAGGANAYNGTIRYPAVSAEGLLRLNPDVIIDLVPAFLESAVGPSELLAEWDEAKGTSAWEKGKIYIKSDDFWTLPGPRFIKVIESLSEIMQPWLEPPTPGKVWLEPPAPG